MRVVVGGNLEPLVEEKRYWYWNIVCLNIILNKFKNNGA